MEHGITIKYVKYDDNIEDRLNEIIAFHNIEDEA